MIRHTSNSNNNKMLKHEQNRMDYLLDCSNSRTVTTVESEHSSISKAPSMQQWQVFRGAIPMFTVSNNNMKQIKRKTFKQHIMKSKRNNWKKIWNNAEEERQNRLAKLTQKIESMHMNSLGVSLDTFEERYDLDLNPVCAIDNVDLAICKEINNKKKKKQKNKKQSKEQKLKIKTNTYHRQKNVVTFWKNKQSLDNIDNDKMYCAKLINLQKGISIFNQRFEKKNKTTKTDQQQKEIYFYTYCNGSNNHTGWITF